jgi:cytochrome c556
MAVFRGSRALAVLAAGVVFVSLTGAGPDPVGARVHGFRELGAAFKNVNDELRSGTPQVMTLQIAARQIRGAAQAQYGWFPAGSGPKPGVKTAAKPEIWSQAAAFKAAQDKFAVAANGFFKVAAAGDVAGMRAQAKPLGAACKACHTSFRTEGAR